MLLHPSALFALAVISGLSGGRSLLPNPIGVLPSFILSIANKCVVYISCRDTCRMKYLIVL